MPRRPAQRAGCGVPELARSAAVSAASAVFTEDDERFEVFVRASRSGAVIFIECESRDTAETHYIDATDPRSFPTIVQPRRRGIEYRADHAYGPVGGGLYLVTNAGATEFRLVKAPVTAPDRRAEVVPEPAGTRLVACDVRGRCLVLTERHGGRRSCGSSAGTPGRGA